MRPYYFELLSTCRTGCVLQHIHILLITKGNTHSTGSLSTNREGKYIEKSFLFVMFVRSITTISFRKSCNLEKLKKEREKKTAV